MNTFTTKVLALHASLCLVDDIINTFHARNTGLSWDNALECIQDVSSTAVKNIVENKSWNIVRDAIWSKFYDPVSQIIWKIKKSEANIEEIAEVVCSLVMNKYDTIVSTINNMNENIQPKYKMNHFYVARMLTSFTGGETTIFAPMNRRFRIFFFFRVHEIIALVSDIGKEAHDKVANLVVEQNNLLRELYELLTKLGDVNIYNGYFVSYITLEKLESSKVCIMICIPHDVIKLIIIYCQLSIYNIEDLNTISITSNFQEK